MPVVSTHTEAVFRNHIDGPVKVTAADIRGQAGYGDTTEESTTAVPWQDCVTWPGIQDIPKELHRGILGIVLQIRQACRILAVAAHGVPKCMFSKVSEHQVIPEGSGHMCRSSTAMSMDDGERKRGAHSVQLPVEQPQ